MQKEIVFPGGWFLNPYGGGEGFLGWMALSPIRHRTDFGELDQVELLNLGSNIQWVDKILREYFNRVFHDTLERLYVVYFFESYFDSPDYHLHIHLIPRTKNMIGGERATKVAGWNIYKLAQEPYFPKEYLKERNAESSDYTGSDWLKPTAQQGLRRYMRQANDATRR
jgi:diadenosine tetraphosphate (Ap4A) HIT family hydrolase